MEPMSLLKFAFIFAAYAQAEQPAATPPLPDLPPVQQLGLASWYGNGAFHGDTTASGEPFDPSLHTCAHRTLPFQTVILIENPSNGRRAWCRINDRGPYGTTDAEGVWTIETDMSTPTAWRGILDMSIAVARRLGTTHVGLQNVAIRHWRHSPSTTINLALWPSPAQH
jgi:rare lipoprotein A